MAHLGGHFAITQEQLATICAFATDDERIEYVETEIMTSGEDGPWIQYTDKAWLAIHCCLTEQQGGWVWYEEQIGTPPLMWCIAGGEPLQEDEENSVYVIRHISAKRLPELVAALEPITKCWMARRFVRFCIGGWPADDANMFWYMWNAFTDLRAFLARMVPTGRSVIFVVQF